MTNYLLEQMISEECFSYPRIPIKQIASAKVILEKDEFACRPEDETLYEVSKISPYGLRALHKTLHELTDIGGYVWVEFTVILVNDKLWRIKEFLPELKPWQEHCPFCGHFFPAQEMEQVPKEDNKGLKSCPECLKNIIEKQKAGMLVAPLIMYYQKLR